MITLKHFGMLVENIGDRIPRQTSRVHQVADKATHNTAWARASEQIHKKTDEKFKKKS